MALVQVTAGNRALTTDVNQFYNLLKGVSGSGEAVTLIYNAAGSLIFQPSSDPAAGTELIQIKNNAGTVQSALSSDGKLYTGDGAVALPAITFEADKTLGIYRPSANIMAFTARGLDALRLTNPASAVNYLQVSGSATLTALTLTAAGTDTNIDINVVPKGTGTFKVNGTAVGATPYAQDPNMLYSTLGLVYNSAQAKVSGSGAAAAQSSDGINLATNATGSSWAKYLWMMGDRGSSTATWPKVRWFSTSVQPATSIAAGTTHFFGVADVATASAWTVTSKHIGFKFDTSSGASAVNWVGTVANGTTETELNLGVAVSTGASASLAFTYDGTTVTFYVNGVNKGTITTNLPTGAFANGCYQTYYIDNKSSAADREVNVLGGTAALAFS